MRFAGSLALVLFVGCSSGGGSDGGGEERVDRDDGFVTLRLVNGYTAAIPRLSWRTLNNCFCSASDFDCEEERQRTLGECEWDEVTFTDGWQREDGFVIANFRQGSWAFKSWNPDGTIGVVVQRRDVHERDADGDDTYTLRLFD